VGTQDPFGIPAPFTAAIVMKGRSVQVRYRAGAGEDASIRRDRGRVVEEQRTGTPATEVERLYRLLAARVIEDWDLRDEDGQPVPVTPAALNGLGIAALQRIVREATRRDR
jgi:hypothetical protein